MRSEPFIAESFIAGNQPTRVSSEQDRILYESGCQLGQQKKWVDAHFADAPARRAGLHHQTSPRSFNLAVHVNAVGVNHCFTCRLRSEEKSSALSRQRRR